jgi:hypothetical protein
MTQMTFGISVQVPNGPQMALTGTQAAEAYDKIELTVDPGGGAAPEVNIQIQPGLAAAVTLVLVKSSVYGADITYRLSDGATDSPPVALDAPLLLLGSAVALCGVAPKALKIKNAFPAADATKKAAIEILIGRDATP